MGTRHLLALLASGLLLQPIAASAAPIGYVINFTVESGGPAPSGEFTYDPALPQFTSFVVRWNGLVFDLVSSPDPYGLNNYANTPSLGGNPNPCIGTLPLGTPDNTFNALSNCPSAPGGVALQWQAQAIDFGGNTGGPAGPYSIFIIRTVDAEFMLREHHWPVELLYPDAYGGAYGGLSITQAVPDSSATLLLFGIGLAGLGAWRKRRQ